MYRRRKPGLSGLAGDLEATNSTSGEHWSEALQPQYGIVPRLEVLDPAEEYITRRLHRERLRLVRYTKRISNALITHHRTGRVEYLGLDAEWLNIGGRYLPISQGDRLRYVECAAVGNSPTVDTQVCIQ